MTATLGKRKRPSAAAGSCDALDVFRRHFEAQFKPLKVSSSKTKKRPEPASEAAEHLDSDDDDDDDGAGGSDAASDWSGLSDEAADDGAPAVEVVDYSSSATPADTTATMTKQERKAYLSSRPHSVLPDEDDQQRRKRRNNNDSDDDDDDDDDDDNGSGYKDAPDLLANDLALQRLISESHLLSRATAVSALSAASAIPLKSSRPFAAGRLRQRATDLRVQAAAHKGQSPTTVGQWPLAAVAVADKSKNSIYAQAKMPMAHRKGIAAAAALRETRRRREARESGIVLERPGAGAGASSSKKKDTRKRLRSVDAPAVGKLRGSELRLRDKDVRAIQGPQKTLGKKRRR